MMQELPRGSVVWPQPPQQAKFAIIRDPEKAFFCGPLMLPGGELVHVNFIRLVSVNETDAAFRTRGGFGTKAQLSTAMAQFFSGVTDDTEFSVLSFSRS